MTASEGRARDLSPGRGPGVDPYADWDGAYVLGALSPAERREFEEHLTTCPSCAAGVTELAGMPGLLAQLSVEEALLSGPEPAAPRDPAPALLAAGAPQPRPPDGRTRRLTRALVAVAAAFVLLAGVVGVAVVRGSFALGRPDASAPFRVAFAAVEPSEITAVVDVVPVATGTDLRLECQYATDGPPPAYGGSDYAIVVIDRAGHEMQVKTWTARPNHVMTPVGPTPLRVSQIAAVEIRPPGSSLALLRAQLP